MTRNDTPITYQGDLAKLPKALALLIARKQWCVWRWTQKPDGSWQKPPFMSLQPERHANTNDPATWTDYATALATVQAHERRFLPAAIRLLCPAPHAPLLARDQ